MDSVNNGLTSYRPSPMHTILRHHAYIVYHTIPILSPFLYHPYISKDFSFTCIYIYIRTYDRPTALCACARFTYSDSKVITIVIQKQFRNSILLRPESLHFVDVENRTESVVFAKVQKREKPVFRVGELGIDNGRGNIVRRSERS